MHLSSHPFNRVIYFLNNWLVLHLNIFLFGYQFNFYHTITTVIQFKLSTRIVYKVLLIFCYNIVYQPPVKNEYWITDKLHKANYFGNTKHSIPNPIWLKTYRRIRWTNTITFCTVFNRKELHNQIAYVLYWIRHLNKQNPTLIQDGCRKFTTTVLERLHASMLRAEHRFGFRPQFHGAGCLCQPPNPYPQACMSIVREEL